MQKRSSKNKRPADINLLAASIVADATNQSIEETAANGKNLPNSPDVSAYSYCHC